MHGPICDIPDIVANLDVDDDEFSEDEVADSDTTNKQTKGKNSRPIKRGIMQTYLKALQGRLRVEFDNSNRVGKLRDCWLRKHLSKAMGGPCGAFLFFLLFVFLLFYY